MIHTNEILQYNISTNDDVSLTPLKSEVFLADRSSETSNTLLNHNSGWTLLRNIFNDSTKSLVVTLGDKDFFKTNNYLAAHFKSGCSSFIKINSSTLSLHVNYGIYRNAAVIDDMVQQVRLAADIGRNILHLQKQAREHADLSWLHYEHFLHEAELCALQGKPLMTTSTAPNHGTLSTLIYQKLAKADCLNAFAEYMTAATNTIDVAESLKSIQMHKCNKFCTNRTILKWIEQQRANMQQIVQSNELQKPIFLDISYQSRDAVDDRPIILLDSSCNVKSTGVSSWHNEPPPNDYAASRAGANVMVSAIRTAAALELPINLTAIMPLTALQPNDVSMSHVVDALPSFSSSSSSSSSSLSLSSSSLPMFMLQEDSNCILTINVRYEPESVCDIGSYGTQATISLIFNTQFPIWRHYNLSRDVDSGQLEPLWQFVSHTNQQYHNKAAAALCAPNSLAHADCSSDDMHELLNLSERNIVPYILWHNHANQPYRTIVRFFRETSTTMA